MNHIRKETAATYGLVIVALFWGMGFPALKIISGSIPTFYLIGLRFFIAAVFLCIIFFKKFKNINKALIRSAFLLSLFLFLTYAFTTLGIQYTTSAKASFFSCLGLLIIPIILRLFYKERIGKQVFICIVICTVGLFFISYTKGMGLRLALGDIICLGCSVASAFHVVLTGRVARNQDPALLAALQLFFISIWSFATALIIEDFPDSISSFHWSVLIFLAFFCTAAAFVLLTACQRYISPSRAGVILAIEPVSGALFSSLLLGDHLGFGGFFGGALIFSSLIYMEIRAAKGDMQFNVTGVSPNQISENILLPEHQEQCDTSQKP